MPVSVTLSNRQRQVKIKLDKWKKLSEKLFTQVLHDLSEKPGKHLSRRKARELAQSSALSIVFVSDRKIKELNKVWRGKDRATDVLSFPADEPGDDDETNALSFLDDPTLSGAIADESEPIEVGEIIVSLTRAQEQAREYGHSFDRELAFLIVHGILHVLGFDHITKAQEKDMFSRQAAALDALGLSRRAG